MGFESGRDGKLWSALRERLEEKRIETFNALKGYPPQVAGCDTHYQFLAEQRARISGELRQLEALRNDQAGEGFDEFVRASIYLDDEMVASLRAQGHG